MLYTSLRYTPPPTQPRTPPVTTRRTTTTPRPTTTTTPRPTTRYVKMIAQMRIAKPLSVACYSMFYNHFICRKSYTHSICSALYNYMSKGHIREVSGHFDIEINVLWQIATLFCSSL